MYRPRCWLVRSPPVVIRDAWRQLSYGCLTPLALLIEESSPLTVSFDFSRLMTGDSAGASRAFRSLVEAGLTIEEAADNTGIRLDSAIPPEQRAEPLLRLDTDRYVNNS